MNGRPALPCPPWCNGHHATSTSHQGHRYDGGEIADVPYATLYLSDNGADSPELASLNGRLSLFVTARDAAGEPAMFDISLDDHKGFRQASDLARLLEMLGRPGLAAAIGEVLELAGDAR